MLKLRGVAAHCDIPCKIYDPAVAQVSALSVVRLMDIIAEVGTPKHRMKVRNSPEWLWRKSNKPVL